MNIDKMKPKWRCSGCGADCETDWERVTGPAADPALAVLTRVTLCGKCGPLPVKTPNPARKAAAK